MVDEFGDSAVELEDLFALLDDGACLVTSDTTPVDDAQLEAGYEEGGLTGTFDQVLVVELGLGEEDLRIGPVLDTGAGRTALCFADDVQAGRLLEGLEGIVGTRGAGGVVKRPGTPRRKDILCTFDPRVTSTSRRADRALTTEAPTPCRPPDAA